MPLLPPLLSGSLPSSYPGPHPVGYASLRHLPSSPSPASRAKFPSSHKNAGEGVFEVREVGYAVFYPCEKGKGGWFGGRGGVGWLMRPVWKTLQGYARFTGNHPVIRAAYPILRLLGGRLKIPIHPLTPLGPLPSPPPLLIFSHGLAGSQTAYSHLCASWASEGWVVLAVEHRDGSGPYVSSGGVEVEYLKSGELSWEGGDPGQMKMREIQLDMRVREVYEVYHGFRSIVENGFSGVQGLAVDLEDGKPTGGIEGFIDSWKGKIDISSLTLTGHSFGGATLLHLLSTRPPLPFTPLPVERAVALDPWCEPLAAPTKKEGERARVPLLVVNSEGFTVWKTHFERVVGLVNGDGGDLVTIVGCDHQSFSDFPLIVTPTSASTLLTTIHSLTLSFLRGKFTSCPEVVGKTPDGGVVKTIPKKEGEKGKTKMVGEWGEVVVHLVGED